MIIVLFEYYIGFNYDHDTQKIKEMGREMNFIFLNEKTTNRLYLCFRIS